MQCINNSFSEFCYIGELKEFYNILDIKIGGKKSFKKSILILEGENYNMTCQFTLNTRCTSHHKQFKHDPKSYYISEIAKCRFHL